MKVEIIFIKKVMLNYTLKTRFASVSDDPTPNHQREHFPEYLPIDSAIWFGPFFCQSEI